MVLFHFNMCELYADCVVMSYNPLAVLDALESVPDVPPDNVEQVANEIGMMAFVAIDQLMPILGKCGIKPRQALHLRRVLEGKAGAAVGVFECVHVCLYVCMCM